ncbi:MAG: MupG family TIM beta-alpha barrel fold protein [Solibacillus sp.]
MRRLGIAVYPQHSTIEELKAYIQLAHQNGFDRMFTCLMSLTNEQERNKLQQVNAFAKSLGFDISADIAPSVFQELGKTYRDAGYFKEQFHVSALRLDMGFSGQEEAFMTLDESDIIVELNMSNGTKYVETILSYEANRDHLLGCHNFYPRKYTALSRQHFMKTSQQFKDHRIRTAAMISSQHGKFGPWEETLHGLPTLEEHRDLPITVQAKDLWNTGLIDDLIIGNMFASEQELQALGQLNRHKLELQVSPVANITAVEEKIVFDEPHFNRGDVSEFMIRSTQSRVKFKEENFPAHTVEPLQFGDVTIDNNEDIRYKGELQIVLKEMPNEGTTNIVGTIVEEEKFLLNQIKPWQSFKLVK